MATQVSLNSGAVASAGALAIQTNGTTQAVSISTGQIATLAQNPILTSGTANGVAYLNGSKAVTSGSALVFDATNTALSVGGAALGTAANRTVFTLNGVSSNFLSFGIGGTRVAHFYSDANEFAIANAAGASGFITMQTNGAEKMRLDSSGDLAIGTSTGSIFSTSGINLSVSNSSGLATVAVAGSSGNSGYVELGSGSVRGALIEGSTNYLAFYTNSTGTGTSVSERARIDSNGTFSISQAVNASCAVFTNSNTSLSGFSNSGLLIQFAQNTTDNSYSPLSVYNSGAGAYKFRVADSGNVTNTNNSYGQISDIKLKENIVDATPKLENLNQVRVVNFNFIGDTQKQIGVVAQELETVFPGMIDESCDRDAEGNDLGTTTKSVKYSVFVPMLIKAIQEQQAIITQLTARITALEGA